MKDKIKTYMKAQDLLHPGDRVVCALSGGADSVALAHVLLSLREELGITVTAAHYNHCLRGEASDQDEAFVRRLCASWGLSLAVGRGDVRGYAQNCGRSVEEAARILRYGFLKEQEGLIAVAHHGDDQVETVLLNLLRGTGLRGLCAMAPRGGRIIRPLLCVTRAEIEAYLQANGLPHVEDRTNGEDDALRNRLRHHVIPLLEQENPGLSQTVARMTGLLRLDEAYLEQETRALLDRAARDGGWDCAVLRQAPEVLRKRALRQLLTIPKPGASHVEALEQLIAGADGTASAALPGGLRAVRTYGLLTLEQPAEPEILTPLTLRPGETAVLSPWQVPVSASKPVILEKKVDFICTFAIRYAMIKDNPNLWIRPRRQGDVIRLPGGHKTLKKWMIDRKIPVSRRNLLPVVETAEGLAGVLGLGADQALQAQIGEEAVIVQINRGEMWI